MTARMLTTLHIDGQQAVVLADTFKKADVNGDGVLSPEEIKHHLAPLVGLSMENDQIEDFIKRADADGDGKVDYDEFVRLLLKSGAR